MHGHLEHLDLVHNVKHVFLLLRDTRGRHTVCARRPQLCLRPRRSLLGSVEGRASGTHWTRARLRPAVWLAILREDRWPGGQAQGWLGKRHVAVKRLPGEILVAVLELYRWPRVPKRPFEVLLAQGDDTGSPRHVLGGQTLSDLIQSWSHTV